MGYNPWCKHGRNIFVYMANYMKLIKVISSYLNGFKEHIDEEHFFYRYPP
jgi:hypothetical protein